MPKFNLDINGADQGAADGYASWGGELPPTGTYSGVLKIAQITETSARAKNPGKPRIKLGVELTDAPYAGYVAWGGVNLIDSGIPYVNQWLRALTDGSDKQFEEIKKAFYGGFGVDDRKSHVTDIGRWKVNSPNGEIPIKVSLKQRQYTNPETQVTTTQVSVEAFLVADNATGPKAGMNTPTVAVEESTPSLDLDDEDIFEDA